MYNRPASGTLPLKGLARQVRYRRVGNAPNGLIHFHTIVVPAKAGIYQSNFASVIIPEIRFTDMQGIHLTSFARSSQNLPEDRGNLIFSL